MVKARLGMHQDQDQVEHLKAQFLLLHQFKMRNKIEMRGVGILRLLEISGKIINQSDPLENNISQDI